MTNSLLIYEESGYLFNDTTKRLEWFEIDKILISFTYGVVRYIGTWGGGRTDKMLEGERFYSSEECFKKGDSIPKRKISIYDAFRSLYGFSPIDDYVWEYKNGRAVRGKLESFDVVINHKGELRCSKTYYASEEDVYRFNDLIVVDKNGDIRMAKSPKSKLMLTRSRRIQWNGCRVQDAASGLWSGSSITGEPRRAGAGQTVIVIGACKRKVLCRS